MTAIVTRAATKADAGEIALLVNVATHGGVAFGWAHDERAGGTYDPIEVGRLEVLDDGDSFNWRHATIAATEDGEVAGMMLGYPEPDTAAPLPDDLAPFIVPILTLEREAAGYWFLSMLGVHKPWRGQGIGARLLGVADELRAATEGRGVALITEDANTGAQRLYARHGFAVRDRRPMVPYPDGTTPGKDWLLMTKD